jgi:cytidylate kinase
MVFQIAIDGPSGSGKSTVARRLSERLGFVYVDTGAMYRAVGLYCDANSIDAGDERAVGAVLDDIGIEVRQSAEGQQVYLNGENVTLKLRTPRAGMAASAVAVHSAVRERLTALAREMAETGDIIMDGRDICAYVLPNADVKVYLDASTDTRARRRCDELDRLGVAYDFADIKRQIEERDRGDSSRQTAPLAVADGAAVIATCGMDADEVADTIAGIVNKVRGKGN